MPKTINPIRKNIVKQALLKGSSYRQALISAGYKPATYNHNLTKDNKLLNTVRQEIEEEFKLSDITPQYVISRLKNEAETAKNSADRIRAYELLGKYLALFTEKNIIENNPDRITIVYAPTEKRELEEKLDKMIENYPTRKLLSDERTIS